MAPHTIVTPAKPKFSARGEAPCKPGREPGSIVQPARWTPTFAGVTKGNEPDAGSGARVKGGTDAAMTPP